jgi:heme/copper-type cytochrome/quinol oxidase subunit 2
MISLSSTIINNAITTAYTTGTFDKSLTYYATINDVIGLQNCTLTQTTITNIYNPTNTPTTTPINKPTTIIKQTGLIIGIIFGIITLIIVVLVVVYKNKKQQTVEVSYDVELEVPTPMIHRISMMSSSSSSTTTTTLKQPLLY